jgi:hypothetical protein
MKATLIERLIVIILKLLLPYLKKKVAETETRADDVIVQILSDLTKPLTDKTENGGKNL